MALMSRDVQTKRNHKEVRIKLNHGTIYIFMGKKILGRVKCKRFFEYCVTLLFLLRKKYRGMID